MCGVWLVDSANLGVVEKHYHMTVEALQFSIKLFLFGKISDAFLENVYFILDF